MRVVIVSYRRLRRALILIGSGSCAHSRLTKGGRL